MSLTSRFALKTLLILPVGLVIASASAGADDHFLPFFTNGLYKSQDAAYHAVNGVSGLSRDVAPAVGAIYGPGPGAAVGQFGYQAGAVAGLIGRAPQLPNSAAPMPAAPAGPLRFNYIEADGTQAVFIEQGNGAWINVANGNRYGFRQVGRDASRVIIRDDSRNMTIQLSSDGSKFWTVGGPWNGLGRGLGTWTR